MKILPYNGLKTLVMTTVKKIRTVPSKNERLHTMYFQKIINNVTPCFGFKKNLQHIWFNLGPKKHTSTSNETMWFVFCVFYKARPSHL